MAANVESMFYTRKAPWHGLGVRVEEAPESKEALIQAGLDWKVEQTDVYAASGQRIPGYKANIRDIDLLTVTYQESQVTDIRLSRMKKLLLLQMDYWEKG